MRAITGHAPGFCVIQVRMSQNREHSNGILKMSCELGRFVRENIHKEIQKHLGGNVHLERRLKMIQLGLKNKQFHVTMPEYMREGDDIIVYTEKSIV